MSFFGSITGRSRYSGPDSSLSKPEPWLSGILGAGARTKAAARLNETTALGIDTVWACVRVIAEDVAKLPLVFYRRDGDSGRQRFPNHPGFWLLNRQANDDQVPGMLFREVLTAHALLGGNGYAEIQRDKAGRPAALWGLPPAAVKPWRDRDSGRIMYRVLRSTGGTDNVPAEDMFHLRGLGYDGLVGYSVVRMARESMGLSLAAEEAGAGLFERGFMNQGVLTSPNRLSEPAQTRLKEWAEKYGGSQNAGKLPILEEGLTWNNVQMNLADAQFLDTRKFSIGTMARWFRMKPHKIADLERSTHNNIEQENTAYFWDCLYGWCARWEAEVWMKLLLPGEQKAVFAEHLADAMLRGDSATRREMYKAGVNWGWYTLNDIRRMENLDPYDGEVGDVTYMPINITTAKLVVAGKTLGKASGNTGGDGSSGDQGANGDQSGTDTGASGDQNKGGKRASKDAKAQLRAFVAGFRPVILDGVRRVIHTETDKARRSHKAGKLQEWAGEFYDGHAEHLRAHWKPFLESMAAAATEITGRSVTPTWTESMAAALGVRHVDRSRSDLASGKDVEAVLLGWTDNRLSETADAVIETVSASLAELAGEKE